MNRASKAAGVTYFRTPFNSGVVRTDPYTRSPNFPVFLAQNPKALSNYFGPTEGLFVAHNEPILPVIRKNKGFLLFFQPFSILG